MTENWHDNGLNLVEERSGPTPGKCGQCWPGFGQIVAKSSVCVCAVWDRQEKGRKNGSKSGGGGARNLAGMGLRKLGFGRKPAPSATHDIAQPKFGIKLCRRHPCSSTSEPCEAGSGQNLGDHPAPLNVLCKFPDRPQRGFPATDPPRASQTPPRAWSPSLAPSPRPPRAAARAAGCRMRRRRRARRHGRAGGSPGRPAPTRRAAAQGGRGVGFAASLRWPAQPNARLATHTQGGARAQALSWRPPWSHPEAAEQLLCTHKARKATPNEPNEPRRNRPNVAHGKCICDSVISAIKS